jgi:hypothetical protein
LSAKGYINGGSIDINFRDDVLNATSGIRELNTGPLFLL